MGAGNDASLTTPMLALFRRSRERSRVRHSSANATTISLAPQRRRQNFSRRRHYPSHAQPFSGNSSRVAPPAHKRQRPNTAFADREWEEMLGARKSKSVDKRLLNLYVLEHLILSGNAQAAKAFLRETHLGDGALTLPDLTSVGHRREIRAAILSGNTPRAVELINDFDPEILESERALHFHLSKQQLLELIKRGNAKEALLFARDELAPHAEENPAFLKELQIAMMFLAYKDAEAAPPEVKALLDDSQRQSLADEVNHCILSRLGGSGESELHRMLKMLKWSEGQLSAEGVVFPSMDLEEGAGTEEKAEAAEVPYVPLRNIS